MSQVDTSIYGNIQQFKLPDYIASDQAAQRTRLNGQAEQENALKLKQEQQVQDDKAFLSQAVAQHSLKDESGRIAMDDFGLPKIDHKAVTVALLDAGKGDLAQRYVASVQEHTQAAQQATAAKQKGLQAEHDKLMVGLSRVPEAERPAAYAKWVSVAKQRGAIPGDVPDVYDPAYVEMQVQKQISPEKALELESRKKDAKAVVMQQVKGRNDVAFNPATGSYVPTGEKPPETQADPSRISGVTVDSRGNKKVEPQVAKQFKETQEAVNTGDTILKMLPDVKAAIPVASSTKVGGAVAEAVGAGLGLNIGGARKTADANKRLEGFATFALGVLDSPLMKGAPSEGDARRALGIINNATASPEEKLRAVEQFEGSVKAAQTRHNEALEQYDDETHKYLRGLGVKPAGAQASAAKPAGTRQIPMTRDVIRRYVEANKAAGFEVSEEQAKAALLKSGKFSQ